MIKVSEEEEKTRLLSYMKNTSVHGDTEILINKLTKHDCECLGEDIVAIVKSNP